MAQIATVVSRIVNRLAALDRPVIFKLRPGLAPEQVAAKLAPAGVTPPGQLVELYGVHDGTEAAEGDILDDLHFFPGFYWMKLDDAIASYLAFRDDTRWNGDWLPIFENGGGDFYAVICNAESPLNGHIVNFLLGEPEQLTEARSIEALMQAIDACFEEGVYYAEGGYLEADDSRISEVGRRVDPGFVPAIVA